MNDAPATGAAPAEPEPPAGPEPVEAKKPRRRFVPSFSLRSLTLCVLLAASGLGLWWNQEPWGIRWCGRAAEPEASWHCDAVTFSPDGSDLLTMEYGVPTVRRASDGGKRFELAARSDYPDCVGYSSDGRYIVMKDLLRGSVRIWTGADGAEVREVEDARRTDVLGVVDDLLLLVAGEGEGAIIVRGIDLKGGEQTFAIQGRSFRLDRTGRAIARVTANNTLEGLELPGLKPMGAPLALNEAMRIAEFDAGSGRTVLMNDDGDQLRTMNIKQGGEQTVIETGRLDQIYGGAMPDLSMVVVGSYDEAKVNAYDSVTGERLWSTDDSPVRYNRIVGSGDGKYLAISEFLPDLSHPIRTAIVESRTGRVLKELAPQEGQYTGVQFGATAMRVLAVEADGTLAMWERRRPEQWWGVAWLPEFWLTAFFALLLVWSLIRDFKTLRKAKTAG